MPTRSFCFNADTLSIPSGTITGCGHLPPSSHLFITFNSIRYDYRKEVPTVGLVLQVFQFHQVRLPGFREAKTAINTPSFNSIRYDYRRAFLTPPDQGSRLSIPSGTITGWAFWLSTCRPWYLSIPSGTITGKIRHKPSLYLLHFQFHQVRLPGSAPRLGCPRSRRLSIPSGTITGSTIRTCPTARTPLSIPSGTITGLVIGRNYHFPNALSIPSGTITGVVAPAV